MPARGSALTDDKLTQLALTAGVSVDAASLFREYQDTTSVADATEAPTITGVRAT